MKKVWLSALLFWVVVSVLACGLYPVTLFDPCARYAPMADAFACGDWYYAFHPRFGVLFTSLAGALTFVTGLPGICTVQIAAFLLLALSAVVMFAFTRHLSKSDTIAWWTFVLVLLAPDFFRYALDGLRDPSKCLVFALIGYTVVAPCSWAFALALLLYISSFTYGFAVSSVLVFLWGLACLWRRDWTKLPLPMLGWVLGTAIMTVLTHAYTGHWLPAPQFIPKLGAWL